MTLLKDIRLLLIIGLAILCLLALRLCSSEYQPQTAARDGTLETSGQTEVAENASDEAQQEETQQSESTAKTETQGIVSNQQASDESTVVADEDTATDAGSDETESKADESEAEAEAGDIKDDSAEATGTSDTGSAAEPEATSTEAETEETAAAEDSATEDAATTNTEAAQNSEDSAAVATTTEYEVVPSTIEADSGAGAEVVRIVLREPSANGDLQTDIDTIQDGLDQYGEKLGVVKTLIESISK